MKDLTFPENKNSFEDYFSHLPYIDNIEDLSNMFLILVYFQYRNNALYEFLMRVAQIEKQAAINGDIKSEKFFSIIRSLPLYQDMLFKYFWVWPLSKFIDRIKTNESNS